MRKTATFRCRDEKQETALRAVLRERERQDRKWGDQTIPEMRKQLEWLAILGEEFGELSKAVLDEHFSDEPSLDQQEQTLDEAVQVAAVALAIVESLSNAEREDEDV